MGILRTTLLRGLLYAAALAATVAASLLVARRLSPGDYALYQTVTKRLVAAAGYLVAAVGVWAYRAAARRAAEEVTGGLLLSLAVSAAAAAAGYLAAQGLGAPASTRLLAALAALLATAWAAVRITVNAAMPVYAAAATLARRLSYSLLVFATVYLMGLGVDGALASFAASQAAVLAYTAARLARRGLLSSRLREAAAAAAGILRRLYASLIPQLGGLLASGDVAVAYALSTRLLVAGWFAATNMSSIVAELASTTLSNLHGYVLATGEAAPAVMAVRLTLAAAAPLLGLMAVLPEHLVYLVNPRYAWAAPALRVAAAAAPLLVSARGAQLVLEGLTRGPSEARRLARLYASTLLPSSLAYLAALALGLKAAAGRPAPGAVAWSLAAATQWAVLLALLLARAPRGLGLRRLPAWAAGYMALGVAAAVAGSPLAGPPSRRFLGELVALARVAAASLPLYAALVLALDPWLRAVAARGLASLRRGSPRGG